MATSSEHRQRVIELSRLLNELWWDILAGDGTMQAMQDHKVPLRGGDHLISFQRMILAHLAVVLAKLGEVHRHYGRYMPSDCRAESKALYREIDRRGVRDLRNKVLGHIWDDQTMRPLPTELVEKQFNRLVDTDSEAFFAWMRNAKNPADRSTVMGTLMWIRDRLISEHGVTLEELQLRPSESADAD